MIRFTDYEGADVWVNPIQVLAVVREPDNQSVCRLVFGPSPDQFIRVQGAMDLVADRLTISMKELYVKG